MNDSKEEGENQIKTSQEVIKHLNANEDIYKKGNQKK